MALLDRSMYLVGNSILLDNKDNYIAEINKLC
jgi:hypothetical protein